MMIMMMMMMTVQDKPSACMTTFATDSGNFLHGMSAGAAGWVSRCGNGRVLDRIGTI